jgi:hypothetical protein
MISLAVPGLETSRKVTVHEAANHVHPTKRTARIAGLLYLLVAVTGGFSMLYVPDTIHLPPNSLRMK